MLNIILYTVFLEKIKPRPLPKPNLFHKNPNDCNCDEPQKYAFNYLMINLNY